MTQTVSTLPTMTMNGPQSPSKNLLHLTMTSPTTKVIPPRISTPTSMTASLTTFSSMPASCYLCDEQNPGDFTPTTTHLKACLLCNRAFCPIHSLPSYDQVCNINHSQYYHDCLERARQDVARRRSNSLSGPRDPAFDESEAEETLSRDGVFPSLGEREKMLWTSSPVSDERVKEIQNLRSLDAESRGTKGQRRSTLIETREMIGADIAV